MGERDDGRRPDEPFEPETGRRGGGERQAAGDDAPLVLRARPRLRRLSRTAVALAGVAAMVVLMLVTLSYSRQSLSAVREARPPLSGAPPVGVDRIERFEAPEGVAAETVEVTAPPAVPVLAPWPPPPRERSSQLRSALRSPVVAATGGRSSAGRGGAGAEPPMDGFGLPRLGDFERAIERAGSRGPALLGAGGPPPPATPVAASGAARNLLPQPSGATAAALERRPPPAAPYLAAGTFVPALVSHRVVSDQPGLLRAVVSRDVLDAATASRVLIPRGTVLLGRQGQLPGLGQSRLAVVWSRLVFPDGSSADLAGDGLPSAARDGSLGLAGRVRRHWGRRYGAAVLLSLVGAGLQLSQPRRSTAEVREAPGEVVAGSLGLELGRLSQQILRQYADLPPTIELAPGARVHALLTQDLVFADLPLD